ncbi:extracellular metalloprotease [Xylariales sp. PMI_506]|nr:extracellular metalloprotease [Xylariales sp. PMI_506]
MGFKTGVLFAALARMASAGLPIPANVTRCATHDPSADVLGAAKNMSQIERNFLATNHVAMSADSKINTNIYFHVIAKSDSAYEGYIPARQLDDQLDVINKAFEDYGISFTEAGRDYTINSQWSEHHNQKQMKQKLRQGTYADVNVYILLAIPRALGYISHFPQDISNAPDVEEEDGVTLLAASLPDSDNAGPYGRGITLVHELGHWFGLFHTFHGGCEAPNDHVDDTPPEASEAFGCAVGRHTCPGSADMDPIHNYMDYSDDSCLTEFTAGQQDRMHSMWNEYRAQYQQ